MISSISTKGSLWESMSGRYFRFPYISSRIYLDLNRSHLKTNEQWKARLLGRSRHLVIISIPRKYCRFEPTSVWNNSMCLYNVEFTRMLNLRHLSSTWRKIAISMAIRIFCGQLFIYFQYDINIEHSLAEIQWKNTQKSSKEVIHTPKIACSDHIDDVLDNNTIKSRLY